ncbi:ScbA/BarX family gamma-butyrolactone biosynthesis protein [Streptomyces cyaneofuscatus]|uniref:ScbA/BarX family gamma-butyrolactone biosynthesis protein n=1 Tax=Streptomyces cyaneofuscatus TaxID=66883 RepID=UPI003651563D
MRAGWDLGWRPVVTWDEGRLCSGLVAGCWLVVGGWWLVVGGWLLVVFWFGGVVVEVSLLCGSVGGVVGEGGVSVVGGRASLELVHRVRVEDAFAVSWVRTGGERFSVVARWPREHVFFGPVVGGRFDPLLVAETVRQSVMLVLHAGYGVPRADAFLLGRLRLSCVPGGLGVEGVPAEVGVPAGVGVGAEVGVRVVCPDPARFRRSARLRATLAVCRAGVVVATGAVDFQVVGPAVYRRLRGVRTALCSSEPGVPAISAVRAGRVRAGDVLLSATGQRCRWRLRADTRHPVLFQSPKDHVPGMLLLEAARQAAHAALVPGSFVPWRMDVSFHRYAEFDGVCWIGARAVRLGAGGAVVRVTGEQEGRPVFSATLHGREGGARPVCGGPGAAGR